MSAPGFGNVPVIPNASVIRGQLLSIEPGTTGEGSEWRVALEEAHDVPNMANFAKGYIGQTVSIYVRSETPQLATQDRLEAKVTFRGDEQGGRFTLISNEARKI